MKRFILIAFGFLALAFYELSGGKDFDPADTRQASQDIRQTLEEQRREDSAELMAALPPLRGRAPLQATDTSDQAPAPAALDLASFSSVIAPERGPLPEITPDPVEDSAIDDTEEPESLPQIQLSAPAIISVSPDSPTTTENTSITFAGLSASASSDDVTLPEDVRVVSGTLVNLRSGPGTGFEVVDQLVQNTRVEVLEDAGTGWVRLRAIEGGTTGWVADFLLADQ